MCVLEYSSGRDVRGSGFIQTQGIAAWTVSAVFIKLATSLHATSDFMCGSEF
jgi:hypothetical protein